jgi:hypothetical protein
MAKKTKTLEEMSVKEWNRQYNLIVAKEVACKVIVGLCYSAAAVLTALAVGGIVMMIVNLFLA